LDWSQDGHHKLTVAFEYRYWSMNNLSPFGTIAPLNAISSPTGVVTPGNNLNSTTQFPAIPNLPAGAGF
jgi:hypothetical protein